MNGNLKKMKNLMNIYKTYDTVVVPFPFTDALNSKNRPAIILSSEFFNHAGYTILAMITSAHKNAWPLDIKIHDLKSCGLEKSSVIRFKLFTLDNRLIKAKIGMLSKKDQKMFNENISKIFQNLR